MRIILAHNFTTDSYAMESVAIAESLAKSGNEVLFISHHPHFPADYFPFPNCRVVSWPSARPVDFKSLLYYFQLHRKFKPDILLAHFSAAIPCGIVGWLLGCGRRINVYHTAEAANIMDIGQSEWKNRIGRLKRKMLYTLYHKIVCVSHFAFTDIQQFFKVPAEKLCVIHHGINDRLGEEIQKSSSPVKFGFLGRLDKAKQILPLIEIFKTLIHDQKLDIELEIRGDGTLRPMVEQATKGESRIIFSGKLPYAVIDTFILRQHYMILPTLAETFGYVILESMMLGIPVLASAIGGIPEIIKHRECGILFDPSDHLQISRDIEEAVNLLKNNPVAYMNMKRNCRATYTNQFLLSTTVKRYIDLMGIEQK